MRDIQIHRSVVMDTFSLAQIMCAKALTIEIPIIGL